MTHHLKLEPLTITAPAREVVGQLNLRLQHFPHARNAAVAVFHEAFRNHGANHLFAVAVSQDTASEAISVSVAALEAAPVPAMGTAPVPEIEEEL